MCSAGDVRDQWQFSVSATPTPQLDAPRSITNASPAGMRTSSRISLSLYRRPPISFAGCERTYPIRATARMAKVRPRHLTAGNVGQRALSAAARPGPSCFLRCGGAARGAFGPRGLSGGGGTSGGGAARGGAPRLLRERRARCGTARLALQRPRHSARDARPTPRLPLALPRLIGVFGASASPRLGLAFPRRAESNPRAPCLGQADRNRLLRRSRPVLAAADLSDLLMHEFAGLG
jgi:hypothetical protein